MLEVAARGKLRRLTVEQRGSGAVGTALPCCRGRQRQIGILAGEPRPHGVALAFSEGDVDERCVLGQ